MGVYRPGGVIALAIILMIIAALSIIEAIIIFISVLPPLYDIVTFSTVVWIWKKLIIPDLFSLSGYTQTIKYFNPFFADSARLFLWLNPFRL
ncbi:MAG: hypothetical protein ACUVXA_09040 [Candidatus Jordarchaeum sp.]|uniref:hypothetical protein n=1 Tax=Candidatus Jordarchaeum sp. TaxID=2823881 RepID=UPI00404ADCB2